jgi:hypothetical protein
VQIVAGVCQALFVVYFTITHWVRMPPFNDLRHENKPVIATMQIVLGILAVGTLLGYRWALWGAAVAYTLMFASHLVEWWISGIGLLVLASLVTTWLALVGS